MKRFDRGLKLGVFLRASLFPIIAGLLFPFGLCVAQVKQPSGSSASQAAITVRDVSFHSSSLGRDMRYRIYLPRGYSQSSRHLPVLYLLHGFDGKFTDWDTLSHLREYAHNLDLIIVMPDGGNSWYVNSASRARDRFEDYIIRDLVGEVEGHYRAISSRRSRAIAGLSMGGYGALNLALKHPEMYAFAGNLSGALNAPSDLGPRQPAFQLSLISAFGWEGSAQRTENDVFQLLRHADIAGLPYFYLACGEGDVFLELNQQFAAELLEEHARYEVHFAPGGHDWKFWDQSIKDLLPVLMQKISAEER
jgi:putative tributyrin esterase